MSGSKTRSKRHSAASKLPKLGGDKEQIIQVYTVMLPFLRMMTSIIPVPSPEFLFDLYTENQAKRLLVITAKALVKVFGDVTFFDTPDTRLAYKTMLVFACLSQIEFEEYLLRRGVKKDMMKGGGKDVFEKIFFKKPLFVQKGGVSGPKDAASSETQLAVSSAQQQLAAGPAEQLPRQQLAAVSAAGASLQNAVGAVLTARAEGAAAIAEATAQKKLEDDKIIAALIYNNIQGAINDTFKDTDGENKLFEHMQKFMTSLRDEFVGNTEIDLGEPHGKVRISTLKEYAEAEGKMARKSKFLTWAASNQLSIPDYDWGTADNLWQSSNVWAATGAAIAGVGAAWAFFRTIDFDPVPIVPQMEGGNYTVITADGHEIRQQPGEVWVPKEGDENLEPIPFGFDNTTVTVNKKGTRARRTRGFLGFGKRVVKESEMKTTNEKNIEAEARGAIQNEKDVIKNLQKEKADLEYKSKNGPFLKGTPLTEQEKARLRDIDEELAERERTVHIYEHAIPPSEVVRPGRDVNGTWVPGQITYNLNELQKINTCPIGTNYTDTGGRWGCLPVPDKGILVYDPTVGRFVPSATFIPPGETEAVTCKDLSTSFSILGTVVGSAAGVGTHTVLKKLGASDLFARISSGFVGIGTYLAMAPNARRCAQFVGSLAITSVGSAVCAVGAAVGLGGAGYFVYKQYKEREKKEAFKKQIADAHKSLKDLTDVMLKNKVKELFMTPMQHYIKNIPQDQFSAAIVNSLSRASRNAILTAINTRSTIDDTLMKKIIKDILPTIIDGYLKGAAINLKVLFENQYKGHSAEYQRFFSSELKDIQLYIINELLADIRAEMKDKIVALYKLHEPAPSQIQRFGHSSYLKKILELWRTEQITKSRESEQQSVAHNASLLTSASIGLVADALLTAVGNQQHEIVPYGIAPRLTQTYAARLLATTGRTKPPPPKSDASAPKPSGPPPAARGAPADASAPKPSGPPPAARGAPAAPDAEQLDDEEEVNPFAGGARRRTRRRALRNRKTQRRSRSRSRTRG